MAALKLVADNAAFVATFNAARRRAGFLWLLCSMMRFFISRKHATVLLHSSCWLLLFGLPYLFHQPYSDKGRPHVITDEPFEMHRIISFLTQVGLFYLNAYLLLPRLYFNRQYNRYFLAIIAVLFLLSAINWVSFHLLLSQLHFRFALFLITYFFPCLFVLAISTAYAFFLDRVRTDRLAKETETETLKTELSFLRSQVSPHFLFNVLNNMVALARKGSDQLEPSLIKLSSLLRYMLYETTEEKVPLDKEVAYLKSYVDLQIQRFRKTVPVQLLLKEPDAAYEIEPMLLIPFVENAFKHGVMLDPDATIDIELSAVKGMLQLLVRNKYSDDEEVAKERSSGIGLANVERRLNLLYKDHHSLLIKRANGWFTVSLQLNLH